MPAPPVQLTVPTTDRPSFDLAAPGSKSLTNRALLLAALAAGTSRLNGALDAEDTRVMRQALTDLGFSVEGHVHAPVVHGLGGRVPASSARLDLRLSGTSIRFLAALCALGTGRFELDGNARMRERPIGDLIAALRQLGARVTALAGNDCPPLAIEADGLTGGRVTVAGDRSSQFLSALLMVAPYAQGETTVKVTGELQSKPFIDMTVGLMERFGVQVGRESYATFTVAPGVYAPQELTVEGDAMSAGYFWAAAAVTGGRVRVTNLGSSSLQGDRRIIEVLAEMGCDVQEGADWTEVTGPPPGGLRGGSFDLNDMPDQAQTLAVLALFADGPVDIRNVPNLRIKETDRLTALARELVKFGAEVEERADGIRVSAPESPKPAVVETYGDHRMAMAFALAGLRVPGTTILDPACVEKTYPAFFDDLNELAASGNEIAG